MGGAPSRNPGGSSPSQGTKRKTRDRCRPHLEEAYERAELTESIAKNVDAALAQWRALHETAPDDPRVCLALGSRLIMRDDDTGCALVESALEFDEDK